jgi:trans-aconitate methyltransferase
VFLGPPKGLHCMTKVEIGHYHSLFDITFQQHSTKVEIFRHYFLRHFEARTSIVEWIATAVTDFYFCHAVHEGLLEST